MLERLCGRIATDEPLYLTARARFDARMAAAAAERARVYLEELVEKRKETLPEILKESEADDGLGAASFVWLRLLDGVGLRERTHAVTPSPRQRTGW